MAVNAYISVCNPDVIVLFVCRGKQFIAVFWIVADCVCVCVFLFLQQMFKIQDFLTLEKSFLSVCLFLVLDSQKWRVILCFVLGQEKMACYLSRRNKIAKSLDFNVNTFC